MNNAINNTNQFGYDPVRIANKFGNISSLEKKEDYLENKSLLLKQKADVMGRYLLCANNFFN